MTTTPTVNEILTLLDETDCYRCHGKASDIRREKADLNRLARLAARKPEKYAPQVEKRRASLDKSIQFALDHLNEPHTPKSRSEASVSAAGTEAVVDTDLDTRVACPACGVPVQEKTPGRLPPHKTRSGNKCPRRLIEVNVVAPPVKLPPKPSWGSTKRRVAATHPDRVATGSCHTCGKPITGERLYCGRCLSKRHL